MRRTVGSLDQDGLINRSTDLFCKVDLSREKIEMFLKLDLFGSIAMDLHIGQGHFQLGHMGALESSLRKENPF